MMLADDQDDRDGLDELDWLAFRYVAGEMSGEEAATFEFRLADDQYAREAVSRAVGLTQRLADAKSPGRDNWPTGGIAAAVNQTKMPFRGQVARAIGWMAVGAAAASLAFCLVWPLGSGSIEPTQQRAARKGTDPTRATSAEPVADGEVWARLQANDEWPTQPELWLAKPQIPMTSVPADLQQPSSLPRWMLTATASPGKGNTP
jgi:hypothetical protein